MVTVYDPVTSPLGLGVLYPPGAHVYVYGAVPPDAVAFAYPFAPPKHDTLPEVGIAAVSATG